MLEQLQHLTAAYPWGVYVFFLLAPFVQEDAAIIGAASASAMATGRPELYALSVLSGLILSDVWKYWAGRAARTQGWARKYAENPKVAKLESRVVNSLATALMVARFVPGTRIPLYLAAGFFNAPFGKFTAFVTLSAMAYVGAIFLLFQFLGGMAGEKARHWLPLVALIIIAIAFAISRLKKPKAEPQSAL